MSRVFGITGKGHAVTLGPIDTLAGNLVQHHLAV